MLDLDEWHDKRWESLNRQLHSIYCVATPDFAKMKGEEKIDDGLKSLKLVLQERRLGDNMRNNIEVWIINLKNFKTHLLQLKENSIAMDEGAVGTKPTKLATGPGHYKSKKK